ncbi:MAG: cytochrome c family protein [Myxococcales bacterium]|nr:cytochrome c family protein [Myxococcales bacterium]
MSMIKVLLLGLVLAACGGGPKDTIEQLQDPSTCKECHPKHYQQWSGSMHAYASDDPVFIAMNKRGQRETSNQLGTFCVQCHAPMAVKLGLITADSAKDFDPAALPPTARGITCYFCHNVASVADTHNNGLVLAMDDVMRGGAKNPIDSPAHNSAHDPAMAGLTNNSTMCGSCHDVVTPRGVALERTFSEWRTTIFKEVDPTPGSGLPLTCSNCHMTATTDVIADKPGLNVGARSYGFHDHGFPGIDQALTDFPETMAQLDGINAILKPAVAIKGAMPRSGPQPGGICVEPQMGGQITVRMDTFNVGHMFPSGAAQDRRAWLEVKAYDASNVLVFSSGVTPDGMDPDDLGDPLKGFFWDRTFKDDMSPAHFFWDVASYTSFLLKPPITRVSTDVGYDHSTTSVFSVGALLPNIAVITARIRILPVAYSVLDQLIMSGDLDPSIRSKMKVLDTQAPVAVWTKATQDPVTRCNPFPSPTPP